MPAAVESQTQRSKALLLVPFFEQRRHLSSVDGSHEESLPLRAATLFTTHSPPFHPDTTMGCCYSAPDAPDVILPDPEGPCTFTCKKLGMFSDDYVVLADENDANSKWLFLNRQGGLFSGSLAIDLENFVRNNPDAPKKGEILWCVVCPFYSSPLPLFPCLPIFSLRSEKDQKIVDRRDQMTGKLKGRKTDNWTPSFFF